MVTVQFALNFLRVQLQYLSSRVPQFLLHRSSAIEVRLDCCVAEAVAIFVATSRARRQQQFVRRRDEQLVKLIAQAVETVTRTLKRRRAGGRALRCLGRRCPPTVAIAQHGV